MAPGSSPPDAAWEDKRTLIECLYLDGTDVTGHRVSNGEMTNEASEGGLGLEAVRAYMSANEDFHATKFHYEEKFKLWELRKYLPKNEWQALDQIIGSRESTGKQSEVYISGRLVPEKTLKRQRQRYRPTHINTTDQLMELPSGVEIRTPALDVVGTIEAVSGSVLTHTPTNAQYVGKTDLMNLGLPNEYASTLNEIELFDSESGTTDMLEIERQYTAQLQKPVAFEHKTKDDSVVLVSDTRNYISQNMNSSLATYRPPSNGPEQLSGIQSRRSNLMLMKSNLLTRHLLQINFPDFLEFLVLNNFTQINTFGISNISVDANYRSIAHTIQSSSLLSDALFENIVRFAIELGDVRLISTLVHNSKRKFDPNAFVCVSGKIRYTALERSSALCHVELTKELISAGADINASYSHASPLRHALRVSSGGTFQAKKQTILAILSKDPQISSEDFEGAVYLADADVVFRIVSIPSALLFLDAFLERDEDSYVIIRGEKQLKDWPMILCKAKTDDELFALFNDIFVRIATYDTVEPGRFQTSQFLEHMIHIAACFGYAELLKTVLAHSSDGISTALTISIRHHHTKAIDMILNQGIVVDFHHVLKQNKQYIGSSKPFGSYPFITPFGEAIKHKNHALCIYMMDEGAFSSFSNAESFEAALIAASEVGNISMVKSLIFESGFEHEKIVGCYALCMAVRNEHLEIVTLLLRVGAKFDTYSRYERSNVLAEAIYKRDLKVIDQLLYIGASPCMLHGNIWEHLLDWQDFQLINRLSEAGLDPPNALDRDGIRNFLMSVDDEGQIVNLLQELLKIGILLNIEHLGLITLPLKFDSPRLLKLILGYGTELVDSIAFYKASKCAPTCLRLWVNSLIEAYPNGIRNFGVRALRRAIIRGEEDLMYKILPVVDIHGFEFPIPNEDDRLKSRVSPFGEAILLDNGAHTNIVNELIIAGANVHRTVTGPGRYFIVNEPLEYESPLMAAIRSTSLDMVKLIIGAGADINQAAAYGFKWTPLQYAVKLGRREIAEYLWSIGADVNAVPAFRSGGTALQCAAEGGWMGIAEWLLEAGAEINAVGSESLGRTALQYAAENGRLSMVEYLLEKGADHSQLPMAVRLAKKNGHFSLAEFLRRIAEGVA